MGRGLGGWSPLERGAVKLRGCGLGEGVGSAMEVSERGGAT